MDRLLIIGVDVGLENCGIAVGEWSEQTTGCVLRACGHIDFSTDNRKENSRILLAYRFSVILQDIFSAIEAEAGNERSLFNLEDMGSARWVPLTQLGYKFHLSIETQYVRTKAFVSDDQIRLAGQLVAGFDMALFHKYGVTGTTSAHRIVDPTPIEKERPPKRRRNGSDPRTSDPRTLLPVIDKGSAPAKKAARDRRKQSRIDRAAAAMKLSGFPALFGGRAEHVADAFHLMLAARKAQGHASSAICEQVDILFPRTAGIETSAISGPRVSMYPISLALHGDMRSLATRVRMLVTRPRMQPSATPGPSIWFRGVPPCDTDSSTSDAGSTCASDNSNGGNCSASPDELVFHVVGEDDDSSISSSSSE